MIQYRTLKNNLPLTIRSAERSDAEQILAFFNEIGGESENIPFGPGEFGINIDEKITFIDQSIASPTQLVLIAEVSDEIAGMLTFNTSKRPRLQHAGEFGISVRRKYWHIGIGSHLLAYLIDWAKQTRTIRKINLRVRVDNDAAISLYEKYGFTKEGMITRDMSIHGEFIDAYLMGLPIDHSAP
ncbi:GNAT family N-acetyltransferase [Tengunoibacter tsumagoiensis]|uniref:N-acetyltransferase n=1 Tax=Tengunoibacter tsumagoiensis TaxID=2014871 RepID=A0A402A9Z3_9CHLR|nr:GNAT family N-acetyltransferase [Tengunoibacter tsumagoiensis]GCE15949.1 N-acetyltransferase [Tengunoibacter tsumagoiensis]